MGKGKKTTALAGCATVAFLMVPGDPTGASLATGLFLGTGAAIGGTYHATKAAAHAIKAVAHDINQAWNHSSEDDNGKPDSLSNPQGDNSTPDSVGNQQTDATLRQKRKQIQDEFLDCISRLSSCSTGIVVSGTMAFVFPHLLLGTAISSAEFVVLTRKLHGLTKQFGGPQSNTVNSIIRGIALRRRNIAFHITAGCMIKLATLACTLGHDVDAVVNAFPDLWSSFVAHIDPVRIPDSTFELLNSIAQHGQQHYDGIIRDGLLKTTTDIASMPGETVSTLLGFEPNFTPTYADHPTLPQVVLFTEAAAVADVATQRVMEEPLHKLKTFALKQKVVMDEMRMNQGKKA